MNDEKTLLDQRIQGVTKLDQQLVYVPLGAVAAAVYAVAAHRAEFQSIDMASWMPRIFWLVVALVFAGLGRNHIRHHGLSSRRHRLYGTEWGVWDRLAFETGRPIYAGLFAVGWNVGCAALYRLLSP